MCINISIYMYICVCVCGVYTPNKLITMFVSREKTGDQDQRVVMGTYLLQFYFLNILLVK